MWKCISVSREFTEGKRKEGLRETGRKTDSEVERERKTEGDRGNERVREHDI